LICSSSLIWWSALGGRRVRDIFGLVQIPKVLARIRLGVKILAKAQVLYCTTRANPCHI
jgi:hypothetical protein